MDKFDNFQVQTGCPGTEWADKLEACLEEGVVRKGWERSIHERKDPPVPKAQGTTPKCRAKPNEADSPILLGTRKANLLLDLFLFPGLLPGQNELLAPLVCVCVGGGGWAPKNLLL